MELDNKPLPRPDAPYPGNKQGGENPHEVEETICHSCGRRRVVRIGPRGRGDRQCLDQRFPHAGKGGGGDRDHKDIHVHNPVLEQAELEQPFWWIDNHLGLATTQQVRLSR